MTNYYCTTPIFYSNDLPHIGHGYSVIINDVLGRYYRSIGSNAMVVTGVDEHGQKIEQAAHKKGIAPQDLVDNLYPTFYELSTKTGCKYDKFIRTTDANHKIAAQNLWNKMYENGHIYKDVYTGWYAERDEAFYTDDEIKDGKAISSGAAVEWLEVESYFFRLSVFTDKLLAFYNANPDFIKPSIRANELISFIKGGLKDICISRNNITWGIKVPNDTDHVMYVWVDALTNYLTLVGYPNTDSEQFKNFWHNGFITHVIGKDILRFHGVYWLAFLMAAEIKLPNRLLIHGWWTNRSEKISKSVGNVIRIDDLIEKYNIDYLRYFFMRAAGFSSDIDFDESRLISIVNSELCNNIGNLVNRVLNIICKATGGIVDTNIDIDIDYYIIKDKYINYMNNYDFTNAIDEIINLSSQANKLVEEEQLWSLYKRDIEKYNNIILLLLEYIRCIAIMLSIFIPDSAAKIFEQLSLDYDELSLMNLNSNNSITKKDNLLISKPSPIFIRII
ncbi:MAG: methionine--tRNA ligase [Anaplasmataceae bacterium]|nr:methionine--tRNA ligase [Anaplasmataceae bacterium]